MVAVEPQVFDVLVHLIANRDRVVSKDDLIASIWKGRIVSDSAVTARMNAARKAIGDRGDLQKLIRTIPRKGFRFVGNVCTVNGNGGRVLSSLVSGRDSKASPPVADRAALAVLPFTNMTGDPHQDYFADGLSEDIITALAKLRRFFVVTRNSFFTHKGDSVQLKQIAEELGVHYVVEGSVRKDDERVRITAQLTDIRTGRHVWAERYDRNLADVFAVQDEITGAIVAAVEPQLYAAENFRARRKPPDSMAAWDLVMRALAYYWRITRQDNLVAQALLEKAISIDPHYAQAHAVFATTHIFGAHMGWEDKATATPIAERAAQAAILADSHDPWAHYALGSVYLFTHRFDDCRAEFEWALRLNPNFSLAQAYYTLLLHYCGHSQEAELAARRALSLSPHGPLAAIYLGIASCAQFVARDYKESMRFAREAIRHRPDFVTGHRALTTAAGMAGDHDAAKAALEDLRRVQPNISLKWLAAQIPIEDGVEREHYLEGFRRAGLD